MAAEGGDADGATVQTKWGSVSINGRDVLLAVLLLGNLGYNIYDNQNRAKEHDVLYSMMLANQVLACNYLHQISTVDEKGAVSHVNLWCESAVERAIRFYSTAGPRP